MTTNYPTRYNLCGPWAPDVIPDVAAVLDTAGTLIERYGDGGDGWTQGVDSDVEYSYSGQSCGMKFCFRGAIYHAATGWSQAFTVRPDVADFSVVIRPPAFYARRTVAAYAMRAVAREILSRGYLPFMTRTADDFDLNDPEDVDIIVTRWNDDGERKRADVVALCHDVADAYRLNARGGLFATTS